LSCRWVSTSTPCESYYEYWGKTLLDPEIPSFPESTGVRLIHGNNISHGIVEIWQNSQWQTLCAWPQFYARDALVICKQLGFSQGTVLPMAAYGRYVGNYTYPFKGCADGEDKIQDCRFDKLYTPNVCATQDVHYGSVNCFNNQQG
jgi:hypothetical protein